MSPVANTVPPFIYVPDSESKPASCPGWAIAIIVPPFITKIPFESMASPSSASSPPSTIATNVLTSIVKVFLTDWPVDFVVVVFKQSSSAFIT